MKQYHDLLNFILENGEEKQDRTQTGTKSIFGYQMRFDLKKGFPLLTTKKVHFKSVVYELLWFLKGDTNTKYLNDNGVTIWNEWADKNGNLGLIYGRQWRKFGDGFMFECDQITELIEQIKTNPNSRRQIVTAWNPNDLDSCALPPCHILFQTNVVNGKLSLQLYQRSCDVFLGLPFNIASYALLTHFIAQVCDLEVNELIITLGDAHIYNNHLEQVNQQLQNKEFDLPTIELNKSILNIFDFEYSDVKLKNYISHKSIPAKVAI
jgi:thymidylate synthase